MSPPDSRAIPRRRRKAAFTLVEILVAIACLTILSVVMATVFGGASSLVSQSNKRIGSMDAGEAVLGQLSLDISRMVLRNDVDYDFTKQSGDDRLSFYARTTGFDTSGNSQSAPRPLAVVSYQEGTDSSNTKQLNYGALQIGGWPSSSGSAFTLSALTGGVQTQYLSPGLGGDLPLPTFYTALAHEVIRFEYCFVLKTDPGNNTPPQLITSTLPAGINGGAPIDNVAGILVAIVVVDPASRILFPPNTDALLAAQFPDSVDNQDILTKWTPVLTQATLTNAGIPVKAIEGIHIYQRYFPFPR